LSIDLTSHLRTNSMYPREGAYDLINYIDGPLHLEFDPPFICPGSGGDLTIIELGSGTGVVASTIATTVIRPGRDVLFVTDLPDVCPLLQENLQDQMNSGVLIRPLAWGSFEHANAVAAELDSRTLTHIICSDLVGIFFLSCFLIASDLPFSRRSIFRSSWHPSCVPSSSFHPHHLWTFLRMILRSSFPTKYAVSQRRRTSGQRSDSGSTSSLSYSALSTSEAGND
jgi:hypothetical protein